MWILHIKSKIFCPLLPYRLNFIMLRILCWVRGEGSAKSKGKPQGGKGRPRVGRAHRCECRTSCPVARFGLQIGLYAS